MPEATWRFSPNEDYPTFSSAIRAVHPPQNELTKWVPFLHANIVDLRGPQNQLEEIRRKVAQLGVGDVTIQVQEASNTPASKPPLS